MNGWVVHCCRTSPYFLATYLLLTGNPEDPTSSLSWSDSVFSSYEKVFKNSCRQESKKAPLTEGINPRKVYTLSWTLSWGCFFLASLIYCTKKKRYLMVTVQMFLPLRDGRWFDHETRSRWYTHLTKLRFGFKVVVKQYLIKYKFVWVGIL